MALDTATAVATLRSLTATRGPSITIALLVLLSALYLLEGTAYEDTRLRLALFLVIVPLLVLFGVVVAFRVLEVL